MGRVLGMASETCKNAEKMTWLGLCRPLFVARYEDEASTMWDKFYGIHQNRWVWDLPCLFVLVLYDRKYFCKLIDKSDNVNFDFFFAINQLLYMPIILPFRIFTVQLVSAYPLQPICIIWSWNGLNLTICIDRPHVTQHVLLLHFAGSSRIANGCSRSFRSLSAETWQVLPVLSLKRPQCQLVKPQKQRELSLHLRSVQMPPALLLLLLHPMQVIWPLHPVWAHLADHTEYLRYFKLGLHILRSKFSKWHSLLQTKTSSCMPQLERPLFSNWSQYCIITRLTLWRHTQHLLMTVQCNTCESRLVCTLHSIVWKRLAWCVFLWCPAGWVWRWKYSVPSPSE